MAPAKKKSKRAAAQSKAASPSMPEPEPKDYITNVPSEILHRIMDKLFAYHDHRTEKPRHAILDLATTCQTITIEANRWANAWLNKHSDITKYKDIKDKKKMAKRDYLEGKFGLFTWLTKHCVWCGRDSKRRATLCNGLGCCKGCDAAKWPAKIALSNALYYYKLKEYHLLPEKYLLDWPAQIPFGKSPTLWGKKATMFFKEDCAALVKELNKQPERTKSLVKLAGAKVLRQRMAQRGAQRPPAEQEETGQLEEDELQGDDREEESQEQVERGDYLQDEDEQEDDEE